MTKCIVEGCLCDADQVCIVGVAPEVLRTIYTCEKHVGRVKQYDKDLEKAWKRVIAPDKESWQ